MSNTKKTFVLMGGFLLGVALVAGGYKLGAHHQAMSDRSSFSDYLTFIQQQDLDECKDAIGEAANLMTDRCEKMLEEQCPTSSKNPIKAPTLKLEPLSSPSP